MAVHWIMSNPVWISSNKLNDAGNFVPVIAKQATVAKGETPIIMRWDYNALADKDALAGNPNIEVVIPKTGVIAGIYIQAISAYAPHPNAAKLWMEFLYSDEGQLVWLKGIATRSATMIWLPAMPFRRNMRMPCPRLSCTPTPSSPPSIRSMRPRKSLLISG